MKQKRVFTDTVKRFRTIDTESGEAVTVGISDTTAAKCDGTTEQYKSVYLLIQSGDEAERVVFIDHAQARALASALQSYAVRALPTTGGESTGADE